MSTAGHPFAVAVHDAPGKKNGPDQYNFVPDSEGKKHYMNQCEFMIFRGILLLPEIFSYHIKTVCGNRQHFTFVLNPEHFFMHSLYLYVKYI